jgi:hypothetical protein
MEYLVEGLELLIHKVAYTKYDATVLVHSSNYTSHALKLESHCHQHQFGYHQQKFQLAPITTGFAYVSIFSHQYKKPDRKRPLQRPKLRWEDIRIDLEDRVGGMDFVHQARIQWQALMNTVMKPVEGNVLTSSISSFSRMTAP